MFLPDWVWLVFVFAFGCCIGSFLNVVIYRLPRELSIVNPPSRCGTCGKRIRFYDNIPLVSWLALRGKCRYCGSRISVRYFVVELLTGAVFAELYFLYFLAQSRDGMPAFLSGGCFIYMLHVVLLGSLIAASAIDLELWVIPLSICWFATAVGLAGSSIGAYVINSQAIQSNRLLPSVGPGTGAGAAGACAGLLVSLVLLKRGVFKRSYESWEEEGAAGEAEQTAVKHRVEALWEVLFLLPVVLCGLGAWAAAVKGGGVFAEWWTGIASKPAAAGLLGSMWGYFVGCGIVWATRILGTLAFGKEAMGLGDVHLIGAAGAIIGAEQAAVAFFIAPFFGLAWAGANMFFKKVRQIPYGPFLSLGIFTVMIFYEKIFGYLFGMFDY